jgi:uncharacterized membrane-anchored protein
MAQERGLTMLLHSAFIGVVIYFVMTMFLHQPQALAEDRSLVIAGFAMIYMIIFGHGMPTSINKNISFF